MGGEDMKTARYFALAAAAAVIAGCSKQLNFRFIFRDVEDFYSCRFSLSVYLPLNFINRAVRAFTKPFNDMPAFPRDI